MIPGARDEFGRVHVIAGVGIDPSDSYLGGIRLDSVGRVHVSILNSIVAHVNGLPVDLTGAICFETVGVLTSHIGGIPFEAEGKMIANLNQAPGPEDHYIPGGVRVAATNHVMFVTVEINP